MKNDQSENGYKIIEDTIRSGVAIKGDDRLAVTVIGLGPMGQALASAFLHNGHPTTVWNRSPGKANELIKQGAVLAETAADAISAGSLILICVLDYNAVNAILNPIASVLKGRTLVNLTADSPDRSRQISAWAAEHEINYLDGAIMTPTPTIGTPAGVFLYSGPESVYRAAKPVLASLGGTASYLGSDIGRAAAFDVALLDLFWTTMSGYAHALALADAENISPKDFVVYAQGIAAIMPDIMADIAKHVEEGLHPGDQSNLTSASASMEHIIHTAHHHGIDASVLSAAKATVQRTIEAGYGTDNFSRLIELLKKSSV